MGLDYVRLRDQVVQKQIRENGKDGKLLGPGPATSGQPSWDPEPGEDIEQPVKILETKLKFTDVDGKVVQVSDTAFLVSPEGVTVLEPAMNQRMTIDGELDSEGDPQEWQIVSVKRVKPGGTTMFWKVFARR